MLFLAPFTAISGEPAKYVEGTYGKGTLRNFKGIPIVVVQGTPEEIGEQFGMLAVKQAKPLLTLTQKYMKQIGLEKAYPLMLIAAGNMLRTYPEEYRKEIESASRASGIPRDPLRCSMLFPI